MPTPRSKRDLTLNGTVISACPHDCPDACSIITTIENGRLAKISGNPNHPVTQGYICRKFAAAPARIYAKDRLIQPLRRTGKKGSGEFRRISWPEAIEVIAERWKNDIQEHGPFSIVPFYGSGTEGLINGRIAGKRFFNRLGTVQLNRTICTKSGREGYRYTMGASMGADPTAIVDNKLIIAWGCNTPTTSIHHQGYLHQARRNGAVYAVINPARIRGAENADHFLQPRPGSDAALALGMMHVIIKENLHDADFIRDYTLGFEELRGRAEQYPPERVAALTDIPTDVIEEFARLYARLRPSFIYVGPGCQRHSNGGMTLRTLACLPALVGAWRWRGSGLYFPTSTIFPVETSSLEGSDLRPNPPRRYNMIGLADLLANEDPPVRSLYVFNGNPATVLYDQNKLRTLLAREELFTVVHEQYLTDTARYADIVLPATTQFEQDDILFSYYHLSVLLNRQAIAPVGECKSNLETFSLLAEAMGFTDPCFRQDSDEIINDILSLDHPALTGITLPELEKSGWARANLGAAHDFVKQGRFPTPSGRIEFFSGTMQQAGHDPLPDYIPPQESREATPDLFARYPLYFLTSSARASLNSNYAQHNGIPAGKEKPLLFIHAEDAKARNITNGDLVCVFNDRGHCHITAEVGDAVRPGVVACPGLWWDHQYPEGGNPNHTTPDFTGSIGGGSAFNSNLVNVCPVREDVQHGKRYAVPR
jgi:anaerobic selenocysteine-containing dehydrogenase